jgi:hypothetical protein
MGALAPRRFFFIFGCLHLGSVDALTVFAFAVVLLHRNLQQPIARPVKVVHLLPQLLH